MLKNMEHEYQLNPILSEEEQAIITASKGIPISEINKIEVADIVTDLVGDAFIVLNQTKMNENDRVAMQDKIIEDLYDKFKFYTVEEIKKAFWLGSRGQLKTRPEDLVFVSVKGVFEWLVNYRTMIKHKAMRKQREFDDRMPDNQSNEELEATRAKWQEVALNDLKTAYSNFLENGIVNDPYGSIYVYMNNRNYIKLSNDIKKKIYLEELKKHIDGMFDENGRVRGKDRWDINNNRRIIEKYRRCNTDLERMTDPEFKRLVQLTCQEIAIKMTFEGIVELGLTLEEYLE